MLAVGAVLIGPMLPFVVGITAAFLIGVFAGLSTLFRSRASAAGILIACISPFLILLALKAITVLTTHRTVAAVIFSGVAFALFLAHGASPLETYREWLLAHPRLRPETRASYPHGPLRPDSVLLAVVLMIVVIVPAFSPTAAIILLLVIVLALQQPDCPFGERCRMTVEVLGMYITYGRFTRRAPGVWFPAQTVERRSARLWLLYGSLLMALAVGVDLFGPWDLVLRDIPYGLPPELVAGDMYSSPYAWVAPAAYLGDLWLHITALCLLVFIPVFLLLSLYRRPVAVLMTMRRAIEGEGTAAFDADGRTEWQWYIDRLRGSRHVATNSFGEEIHEAEHLLLGVGPNAEFPVLLHENILSEHCYIVGETGSGKTSLGIAPLLMQLIRGHGTTAGSPSPPPAIVILDLKGDNALFKRSNMKCRPGGTG